MARGWHYTKLSLSSALLLLIYSGRCIMSVLLSFRRFCFVSLSFLLLSLELFVDVPLIVFCPADVPDWQPRIILLGMVEARSVNNVKKTTTTKTTG